MVDHRQEQYDDELLGQEVLPEYHMQQRYQGSPEPLMGHRGEALGEFVIPVILYVRVGGFITSHSIICLGQAGVV